MQKYGIPLKTPEMDEQQKKDCSYILIRHGLSKFNYKALVAKTDFGAKSPEHRAVERDTDLIDPELHACGVK